MSKPNRIRFMADEAAATIAALQAELDAAPTRREKKTLRQRIALAKAGGKLAADAGGVSVSYATPDVPVRP
jgi:hypothetical protein